MRISLLLLGLLWLGVPRLFAQSVTVPPEIELALDKPAYERLEPVLLTITLTNPSSEPQGYGPPQPLGYVTYLLTGPDGEEMNLYALYHELVTVITAEPYAPGESHLATINLLDFFPASIYPGTHTLVTRFVDPFVVNGVSSEASVTYEILPEPSSPDADSLAQALLDVKDLQGWTIMEVKDTEQTLERLLEPGNSLPPHADELALFLYALYADVDGMIGRAPGAAQVAQQRYDEFLAQYPDSPYALQARHGHLAVLYEEDELEPLELSALPAAFTVTADPVAASFSGNAFRVSGPDHDAGGDPTASGDDRHAVAVPTEAVRIAVLGALAPNQHDNVEGAGGDADVVVEALPFDMAALVDQLLAAPGLVTLDERPGNQTVGTLDAPAVAYAPDGLDTSGRFEGAGILIVDGALEMRGRAAWRGLVVVRDADGSSASLDLGGNAAVVGAVVLSGSEAGLTVRGSAALLFSLEALDAAQSLLDVP